MEFGDNRLKHITRFVYKWIWCSWVHHKHKCWPCISKKQRGYPNYWHCMKCHPCGECFDIVIDGAGFKWL